MELQNLKNFWDYFYLQRDKKIFKVFTSVDSLIF